MTITVKNKSGLVVPPTVQRKAGIKVGDELEFKVSGGIIHIIPKLPTADDEYTPKQRAVIDAQLKEGLGLRKLDSDDILWSTRHQSVIVGNSDHIIGRTDDS